MIQTIVQIYCFNTFLLESPRSLVYIDKHSLPGCPLCIYNFRYTLLEVKNATNSPFWILHRASLFLEASSWQNAIAALVSCLWLYTVAGLIVL